MCVWGDVGFGPVGNKGWEGWAVTPCRPLLSADTPDFVGDLVTPSEVHTRREDEAPAHDASSHSCPICPPLSKPSFPRAGGRSRGPLRDDTFLKYGGQQSPRGRSRWTPVSGETVPDPNGTRYTVHGLRLRRLGSPRESSLSSVVGPLLSSTRRRVSSRVQE